MRLHRIIPVLLFRNGVIVRSQIFQNHYIIGSATTQFDRYLEWNVDEIVYLDISPRNSPHASLVSILPSITRSCFTPLTIGGNIHTLKDIERCLESGADRVILGSAAISNPSFIDSAAKRFGSQAIVVSLDYRTYSKDYVVYSSNGKIRSEKTLLDWVSEIHQRGSSEILLHSIDRDGLGVGYDLTLLELITTKHSIPLIPCGGAGGYQHFSEAISHGATAVAASNIFGFKELAYINAKTSLIHDKLPVRM